MWLIPDAGIHALPETRIPPATFSPERHPCLTSQLRERSIPRRAALEAGNYDIGFITAIPDVPDASNMLEDFVSNSPSNYSRWADEQFDRLIEESKTSGDRLKRVELLKTAENRLLEEVPVTPLYFNARNWLMSPRVRHWQHDALWTRFYLNVELRDN